MKRYAFALLFLAASAYAQSTPEEAIVKLLTAETQQDVISVLPEKTRAALAKASPKTRTDLFAHFMELKRDKGLKIEARISDDLLTLSDKENSTVVHFKVKQSVNDGMNAVLVLKAEVESKDGKNRHRDAMMLGGAPTALVWARMEEGNWRISGIGGGEVFQLDGEEVLAAIKNDLQPPPQASEASAVGSLRTLNTANVVYASTYESGFAPSIQALGGEGKDPTPEHSLLIDSVLASGEKSGYVFTYQQFGRDAYAITARPKQFGVTGKKNFFTDESGVIRETEEDRPATVHDAPIQ